MTAQNVLITGASATNSIGEAIALEFAHKGPMLVGNRNGFRIAYKRPMPTPQELLRYGERWRPYRTAAAWYLWRAVDQAKALQAVTPLSKPSTRRVSNGRSA